MPIQLTELVLPLAVVAVFWFLVIRPQQTRARQQREMLGRLKVGDEVMTHGGMFGTVVETGDRVRLRAYSGAEFEMLPGAISRIVAAAADTGEVAEQADAAEPVNDDALEPTEQLEEAND